MTHWSSFGSIWKTALDTAKHHRKVVVLLWLLSRVFSQWTNRFLDTKLGFQELMVWVEQNIQNKIPALLSSLQNGQALGVDSIWLVYGDAWALIQPHLPSIIGIRIIGTLLSILVYMIIAHLTMDHARGTERNLWAVFSEIGKEFIPYALTVLMQWLITLMLFGLFIIPGIIAGLYWMFTNIVSLDKKLYYRAAMKESRRIVKWRRRKTLWMVIALMLSGLLLILFFSSIGGFLAWGIGDIALEVGVVTMITTILSVVLQILLVLFYLAREKNSHPTRPEWEIELIQWQ